MMATAGAPRRNPGGSAILARRAIAVILALPLLVLLVASTALGAVTATVLNGDYLADALDDADFYHRVHAEGFPALVEQYIAGQDERLPDNLRGAGVPGDPESVRRVTEVVQSLLPEDLLRQQSDELLREFIPWLAGRRDSFEWDISLHDPLLATFSPRGDGPSLFQAAWVDLEMSHRLLQGLVEGQERERRASGAPPPEEPSVLDRLGPNLPAAERWLDDALFEVIDSIVPFLAGVTEEFDIHLDFAAYAELTEPLAGPLNTETETLATAGWQFNSTELRQKLEASGNPALTDSNQAIAVFRPGGAQFTSADFIQRMEEERERNRAAGEDVGGPTVEEARTIISRVRAGASWGAIAVILLLATGIGLLGGRTWPGRALWGAGAVVAGAALTLSVSTTVYAATVERRIDTWIAEQRLDGDSDLPVSLRAPVLDVLADVAHGVSAAMTWRAAAWLILGLLVAAASLAWPRLRPAPLAPATTREEPPGAQ